MLLACCELNADIINHLGLIVMILLGVAICGGMGKSKSGRKRGNDDDVRLQSIMMLAHSRFLRMVLVASWTNSAA